MLLDRQMENRWGRTTTTIEITTKGNIQLVFVCFSVFTFPIVNLHFHRRVHTRRNFYLNKKRAIAVTHRLTNSRHAGWNEFLPFFTRKKIGGLLTWNRASVFSITTSDEDLRSRILVRILTWANPDKVRLLLTRTRTFQLRLVIRVQTRGNPDKMWGSRTLWPSDCYLGCASHHGTLQERQTRPFSEAES